MAGFYGVHGFVRNLPNGDVYLEAEGEPTVLEEFVKWCKQGPPRAKVTFVDVYGGEVVGFKEFLIK
jgi:acylphosphatase